MRKIYLTLLGFSTILVIVSANDEFYCRQEAGQFQICKTCNFYTDKKNCKDRPSDECKCDNMRMVKSDGSYGKGI